MKERCEEKQTRNFFISDGNIFLLFLFIPSCSLCCGILIVAWKMIFFCIFIFILFLWNFYRWNVLVNRYIHIFLCAQIWRWWWRRLFWVRRDDDEHNEKKRKIPHWVLSYFRAFSTSQISHSIKLKTL